MPRASSPTVVIPVAGCATRMRTNLPKCLTRLESGETVLQRQIRLVWEKWPRAKIVVVGGFEHEKVVEELPSKIKFVLNHQFATTNVAYSIGLGLIHSAGEVLVVYGDLVFNRHALDFERGESALLLSENQMRSGEVGASIIEDSITHLAYGLVTKWCHISLLTGVEKKLFLELAIKLENRRLFGFEIINQIIEKGGSFNSFTPKGLRLAEIDASKDVKSANLCLT